MPRPIPLGALLLFLPAAAFCAPGGSGRFDAAWAEQRSRLAQAFLGGESLSAAWDRQVLERLADSNIPADGRRVEELSRVVEDGLAVQKASGGAGVEAQVRSVCERLGITGANENQAIAIYVRTRRAPGAPGGRTASRITSGQERAMTARSHAMVAALGGLRQVDGARPVKVLPAPRVSRGAIDYRALNAVPAAQSTLGRRTPKAPPPPPSAQQKEQQAFQEADRLIKENPGTVGQAYQYWDRVANDSHDHWWITRAYARLNKGLLTISGLRDVEESSARLGYVWDNPDVSKSAKRWQAAKLGGNAALSFLTFLPAASFAKSVRAGEGLYIIGRSGARVAGMAAATPEAAAAMNRARLGVAAVIQETVPEGRSISKAELPRLIENLNRYGARYGVHIEQGGTIGEATAKGGTITANLGAGAHHETVHLVQQFTTRVMALEQRAAELGTTVDHLSQADRAVAFERAARFEQASYAQFESQALRSTGAMGRNPGGRYAGNLLQNGVELESSMREGTVLAGRFTAGERLYGCATQFLGHSQAEIGRASLSVVAIGANGYSKPVANGQEPVFSLTNTVTGLSTAGAWCLGGAMR